MKQAVVTANLISVRVGRGQEYTKLGTYKKGDLIWVLDEALDEQYAKVIWQEGYAYSEYGEHIEFVKAPPAPEANAIVTASRISVRTGRGTSYEKLGEFTNGEHIVVLDDSLYFSYVHVVWQDRDGYAYCDYGKYIRMRSENVDEEIAKALNIVSSCIGGQYIYGAQGTKITTDYVDQQQRRHPEYFTNGRYEYLIGIARRCEAINEWAFPADYAWDCSGLWWYSANKAGIFGRDIDTTANTFYNSYCTSISKDSLRAGDAVFYRSSSGRITHMGVVGQNGAVHEAMSGYTGVVSHSSVDDRTADRVVGSGTYTRKPWNTFGRPKVFE